MLAMGFLAVLAIYTVMLLVAAVWPNGWRRKLLAVGLVLSPIIYWTADWPLAYWRFTKACNEEGGLRRLGPMSEPAKVIRFDATGILMSPGDAAKFLTLYPWLEAIEGTHPEIGTSRPPVYVRYERAAAAATSGHDRVFSDADVKIVPINRVDRQHGLKVEPGVSRANFVVRRNDESRPTRMVVFRWFLETPDGRPITAATDISYSWSRAQHSFLGQSIAVSVCPKVWPASHALQTLVSTTSATKDGVEPWTQGK